MSYGFRDATFEDLKQGRALFHKKCGNNEVSFDGGDQYATCRGCGQRYSEFFLRSLNAEDLAMRFTVTDFSNFTEGPTLKLVEKSDGKKRYTTLVKLYEAGERANDPTKW